MGPSALLAVPGGVESHRMQANADDAHVKLLLDEAAREVRASWEHAMTDHDYARSTLLTEVGQALHRARLAFDLAAVG